MNVNLHVWIRRAARISGRKVFGVQHCHSEIAFSGWIDCEPVVIGAAVIIAPVDTAATVNWRDMRSVRSMRTRLSSTRRRYLRANHITERDGRREKSEIRIERFFAPRTRKGRNPTVVDAPRWWNPTV